MGVIQFKDKKTGEVIPSNKSFELGGLSFPANWLEFSTDADCAARGIEKEILPEVIEELPVVVEYVPPLRTSALLEALVADDVPRIRKALETNPEFWLLWNTFQSQVEVLRSSKSFNQFTASLTEVLGSDRVSEVLRKLENSTPQVD